MERIVDLSKNNHNTTLCAALMRSALNLIEPASLMSDKELIYSRSLLTGQIWLIKDKVWYIRIVVVEERFPVFTTYLKIFVLFDEAGFSRFMEVRNLSWDTNKRQERENKEPELWLTNYHIVRTVVEL